MTEVTVFCDEIGRRIETVSTTASDVCLVCPFIKTSVIDILLPNEGYQSLVLITRADVEEFAKGVSDLEVWRKIWAKGGEVYLLNNLHAKYYRFDSHVLMGSANLTMAGLALSERKNIELMAYTSCNRDLGVLEENFLRQATLATKEMLEELYAIVEELQELNGEITKQPKVQDLLRRARICVSVAPSDWLPLSEHPEKWLFPAYLGKRTPASTLADLQNLSVPSGLKNELELKKVLAHLLCQTAAYKRIEQMFQINTFPEKPHLSFGTIRKASGLFSSIESRDEKNLRVNALMDWLVYIFDTEFFSPKPMKHSRLLGRKTR